MVKKMEKVKIYLDELQYCIDFINRFHEICYETGFVKSKTPVFTDEYKKMVRDLQLKLF